MSTTHSAPSTGSHSRSVILPVFAGAYQTCWSVFLSLRTTTAPSFRTTATMVVPDGVFTSAESGVCFTAISVSGDTGTPAMPTTEGTFVPFAGQTVGEVALAPLASCLETIAAFASFCPFCGHTQYTVGAPGEYGVMSWAEHAVPQPG